MWGKQNSLLSEELLLNVLHLRLILKRSLARFLTTSELIIINRKQTINSNRKKYMYVFIIRTNTSTNKAWGKLLSSTFLMILFWTSNWSKGNLFFIEICFTSFFYSYEHYSYVCFLMTCILIMNELLISICVSLGLMGHNATK